MNKKLWLIPAALWLAAAIVFGTVLLSGAGTWLTLAVVILDGMNAGIYTMMAFN